MEFRFILGGFWEHFGVQSRSEFEAIFSSPFLGLTRSDATSAGLQRDFDATSTRVFPRQTPPRAAPFSRAEG